MKRLRDSAKSILFKPNPKVSIFIDEIKRDTRYNKSDILNQLLEYCCDNNIKIQSETKINVLDNDVIMN